MKALWLVDPAVCVNKLCDLASEMHKESRFADEPFDRDRVLDALLGPSSIVVGLYNDDTLVGGALLYASHPFWTRKVTVLYDSGIFIAPEHRSFKAFSTLLEEIENIARRLRCTRIELGVTAPRDVERMVALYRRKGFVPSGTLCVKELTDNVLQFPEAAA